MTLVALTFGLGASVPILADDVFQFNGATIDITTFELFDGALRILFAVIADYALVLADVAMSGTVADFACLAHEVLEILPAENE